MKHIPILASILKKSVNFQSRSLVRLNIFSTQGNNCRKKNLESLFINEEVQRILKKITGLDYERIFASRTKEIRPHKYEFVTEERLKELQESVVGKAHKKLQMPPVMEIREPINEILSKDPELQGYLHYRTVFTDISTTISSRDRVVTVRELDGTLRKATWEERDRMNQIYFPLPGRSFETPKMYESANLERLFDEGQYRFVLDSACIQFEPDHPEYHNVTSQTYENIRQMKKFNVLRSTRHFGPMAFYFAYKQNIDPLLIDMIDRQLIADGSDLVRLFFILHPELKTSTSTADLNEVVIVQDYIKNHSSKTSDLELALQTFLEWQRSNLQQQQAAEC